MIAVVSTTYREADILDQWIQHTFAEGIDLILVADKYAEDGTRDILRSYSQVRWVDDTESCHRQSHWIERLADDAHDLGAKFILPLDVDEFIYAIDGAPVAETLRNGTYDKLLMTVWPHKTWSEKFVQPHRLPKCAWRWQPSVQVAMGNHSISLPGGESEVLAIRELQYRSFEHFCQKAADRNATLDPIARARQDGWHHLRLENMDQNQLLAEWHAKMSQESALDPIPSRIS